MLINFMIRHELLAGMISFLVGIFFCAKGLQEIGLHHWRPVLVPVLLGLGLMLVILGVRLVYQNISRGVRRKQTHKKSKRLTEHISYEWDDA